MRTAAFVAEAVAAHTRRSGAELTPTHRPTGITIVENEACWKDYFLPMLPHSPRAYELSLLLLIWCSNTGQGQRLASLTPPWSMSSDIEHWHINAIVHKDCVEETHYVSDPARNIRRRPETTIWQVERLLGRGGFGEVRLERNRQDGRARAVKRIAMMGTNLTNMECEKELKALLEFSKPKVKAASSPPHFHARL
jgi:hypothetical protein